MLSSSASISAARDLAARTRGTASAKPPPESARFERAPVALDVQTIDPGPRPLQPLDPRRLHALGMQSPREPERKERVVRAERDAVVPERFGTQTHEDLREALHSRVAEGVAVSERVADQALLFLHGLMQARAVVDHHARRLEHAARHPVEEIDAARDGLGSRARVDQHQVRDRHYAQVGELLEQRELRFARRRTSEAEPLLGCRELEPDEYAHQPQLGEGRDNGGRDAVGPQHGPNTERANPALGEAPLPKPQVLEGLVLRVRQQVLVHEVEIAHASAVPELRHLVAHGVDLAPAHPTNASARQHFFGDAGPHALAALERVQRCGTAVLAAAQAPARRGHVRGLVAQDLRQFVAKRVNALGHRIEYVCGRPVARPRGDAPDAVDVSSLRDPARNLDDGALAGEADHAVEPLVPPEQPVAGQRRELPTRGDVTAKPRAAQRFAHGQRQDRRAAVGQREANHFGRARQDRGHGPLELDGVVDVVALYGHPGLHERARQVREPEVLVVLEPATDQHDPSARRQRHSSIMGPASLPSQLPAARRGTVSETPKML